MLSEFEVTGSCKDFHIGLCIHKNPAHAVSLLACQIYS